MASDKKNVEEKTVQTRTVGTKVAPIFGDSIICSAGALRAMAAGIDAHYLLEVEVQNGVAAVYMYNGNTGARTEISSE